MGGSERKYGGVCAVTRGELAEPIKVSPRRNGYRFADVEKWLARRKTGLRPAKSFRGGPAPHPRPPSAKEAPLDLIRTTPAVLNFSALSCPGTFWCATKFRIGTISRQDRLANLPFSPRRMQVGALPALQPESVPWVLV